MCLFFAKYLVALGVVSIFQEVSNALEFRYHKNEELEGVLSNFSARSGRLQSRLYSIGNSSDKTHPHPLWVLELSAAGKDRIGIPNVKLLGNIHGNEAGGREVLLQFIEFLIDNYGTLEPVTWLLNNTRLHVLPSMNPDGFAIAAKTCEGTLGREVPSKDVDLNRNFPHVFNDNSDQLAKKDVKESQAVIKWMSEVPFVLSAALHGGALVANYPFDSAIHTVAGKGESLTPDNDVFIHLAKTYSTNHPTMHTGKKCKNSPFKGGITNGAGWYPFEGGMGDYNYVYHGCMEVTLEIDCCKYPKERKLQQLWQDNQEPLLKYCMQANMGITGQVLDFDSQKPIERAKLRIAGKDATFWSAHKTGEFWRILLPGRYELKVEAEGYYTHTENFTVSTFRKYPKLTFLNVLLYNSSKHPTTTTSTEKTTTPALAPAVTTTTPAAVQIIDRFSEDGEDSEAPSELASKTFSGTRRSSCFYLSTILVIVFPYSLS